MNKLLSVCALGAFVSSLSGCMSLSDNILFGQNGLIHDRSGEYVEAKKGKELEVNVDTPTIIAKHNTLVIPELSAQQWVELSDGIPRANYFYSAEVSSKVDWVRKGDERVIVVEAPFESVWSDLESFMAENSITLAENSRETGFMETNWIDPTISQPALLGTVIKQLLVFDLNKEEDQHDRLRIYVKDIEGNGRYFAISFDHLGGASGTKPLWKYESQTVSSFQSDMTFAIVRYLGEQNVSKEVKTLSDLGKESDSLMTFGRDASGNPAIRYGQPFPQTWSSLTTAVTNMNAEIVFSDEKIGTLCFDREDLEAEAEVSLQKSILSLFQDGTEKLTDPLDILERERGALLCFAARPSLKGTIINVVSSGGNAAPSPVSDDLLWELHTHL